jgi:hypothetical protein
MDIIMLLQSLNSWFTESVAIHLISTGTLLALMPILNLISDVFAISAICLLLPFIKILHEGYIVYSI